MKYNFDKSSSILTISLDEEVDVKSCKILRNIIDGYIIRYEPKEVVIDLTLVNFMDSSGIGLLIGRYNLIKMFDSSLTIVNASNSIKRILEVSNLSNKIKLRSCEE